MILLSSRFAATIPPAQGAAVAPASSRLFRQLDRRWIGMARPRGQLPKKQDLY
jgi:hypothetical protein